MAFSLVNMKTSVVFAQSPYELNCSTDRGVILGGIGVLVLGASLQSQIDPLTVDEINKLSKDDINAFDRSSTSKWSPDAYSASNYILASCVIVPTTLLFSEKIKKDMCKVGALYLETLLLTNGPMLLSKGLTKRIRPYAYNPDVAMDEKTDPEARKSFYSGHTANAFASAVFLAKVYSDYYPDSKWKAPIWSAALIGASAVAYLRYESGVHFPTDILAGAVMGSLTGYLVLHLHRKNYDKSCSVLPMVHAEQLQITLNIKF